MIIAHITFCVPAVVLSVLPKLRQINRHIYEAALDLGCNEVQAFFKVILPEIMPGIISGFLMAFTYSVDDFVISYFTAGPNSQTLPLIIYTITRKPMTPKLNALSTIIFVIAGFIALKFEVDAGYYECKKCHHRFIPTYKEVLFAMHLSTIRYLKCPKCHKRSWAKKVMSK
jgi:spermidine/putrescine transport system permease protein